MSISYVVINPMNTKYFTIKHALKDFLATNKKTYGVSPAKLSVVQEGKEYVVKGWLLSSKQQERLQKFLDQQNLHVLLQTSLLADLQTKPLCWVTTTLPLLDLYSKPFAKSIPQKVKNKHRACQAKKGDILRELYRYRCYSLIQKDDLTLGWVHSENLVVTKKQWSKNLQRTDPTRCYNGSREAICKTAQSLLGVPYVWGGTTTKGLDCSGFVQLVLRQSCNLVLPKHSQDQKVMGTEIRQSEVLPGDLILLDRKKDGFHHIGIALGNDDIIHASLRINHVVVWKLSLLKKFYTITARRRIVNNE